jgi:hypothetical protein
MWKLFLLATRLAGQSSEANLRRHAAHALNTRIVGIPKGGLRRDADDLLGMYAADIDYSVREATRTAEN